METVLLVDGHALIHRAYHALPPFKTSKGVPTNAVYGFFTMLYKAVNDFQPTYLAICFDTPKPTFRQELYEKYQIQRPRADDELIAQFPLLKGLLDEAGIFRAEKEGYEADDVIGTIASTASLEGIKTLILTGDKDLMQLIDGNIFVVTPQIGFSKTKVYDRNEVIDKYGIAPEQIADYKALVGDPSDNYPGIKGIGPKGATELLKQFGTIENMTNNLDQIENEKVRQLIRNNKDNLELSKKLSYIVTNVPLEYSLKAAKFGGFKEDLRDAFMELEMRSLAVRFFPTSAPKPEKKPVEKKKEQPQKDTLF